MKSQYAQVAERGSVGRDNGAAHRLFDETLQ
jgi:hypothetical protein